jgi:hypothetical protein
MLQILGLCQSKLQKESFFIKGHSPDFITFITKSQSSTTPDQTKHRHNHPTEFKDATLPKHTPPPPFEQSTKGQPKRGGEGQQPANKVTSQSQRPHRQAPDTNSFHKPYRTNTKTPSLFILQQQSSTSKRCHPGLQSRARGEGERNPAHYSINVPSPWSSRWT